MHKLVHLYTDGGSRGNPGQSAIGFVVCDHNDVVLEEHGERIGIGTNNVAEYRALIAGLTRAAKHTKEEVRCEMDSQLAVRQLTGEYKIKAEHLIPLAAQVRELEKKFKKVSYTHQPREHPLIARADALVNRALDGN